MFSNNGAYYDEANRFEITDKIRDSVNKDVDLVYWDYYHNNKTAYDNMISKHKQLSNNDIWFAGGSWFWLGFTPHNEYTLKTIIPAMQSCKENGVDNIIITMWGDDGGECSKFSLLPSLYHVKYVYVCLIPHINFATPFPINIRLLKESDRLMNKKILPN